MPAHLHQDVALRQQLDGLEGGAVWADESLPPLHKLLLWARILQGGVSGGARVKEAGGGPCVCCTA